MDDELEADVDEDVVDDVAIVDMSTTWHMTCVHVGPHMADFVAAAWQIL
jgi:hypothetical protein